MTRQQWEFIYKLARKLDFEHFLLLMASHFKYTSAKRKPKGRWKKSLTRGWYRGL